MSTLTTTTPSTEQFKKTPIPNTASRIAHYKQIPIVAVNEPLVNVHDYGIAGHNYYNHPNNPPYNESIPGSIPQLLVRKTVAEKLQSVNKILVSQQLELYLFDGYRPLSVQQYMYYNWVPRFYKEQNPSWSDAAIQAEIAKYWAKPPQQASELSINHLPPHLTGAAVDLTLRCSITHRHLEMGSMFDDTSQESNSAYFEHATNLTNSLTFGVAQENRRLLFHLLCNEGFASFHREWWHFSYGDRLWAAYHNQPEALYSAHI